MNDRSKLISRLIDNRDTRESYIRSKLSVLIPSQIRSLRLRRELTQAELGSEAEMKQVRISAVERIGDACFSVETLVRLASAFRVGLLIRFVPMSEMLGWENSFDPDAFNVTPLEEDQEFVKAGQPRENGTFSRGLSDALLGEQLKSPIRKASPLGPDSTHSEASSLASLALEQPESVSVSAVQGQSSNQQGRAA
ncbi:MAG: helix-turn-helix transcriptional regulator [Terracidiphilus sp.]|nr:helix-turn-helix transcriptional regulator [Terracidiphilus sp.]